MFAPFNAMKLPHDARVCMPGHWRVAPDSGAPLPDEFWPGRNA